jgi:LCP family protein required for cell wall assembly
MTRSSVRFCFCLAAALLAAAVADPIVETASNLGLFGHHSYTDHSTLDVIPTLLVATFFAGIWVVIRVRRVLSAARSAAWSAAATAVDGRTLWRLLPRIFLMQIAALFVTESAEQLVVYGHLLGGTIWLGGPILFSLAIHAAFCVALSLSLVLMLRACATSLARFVAALLLLLYAYEPHRFGSARIRRRSPFFRPSQPTLCRLGERAPPTPTIAVPIVTLLLEVHPMWKARSRLVIPVAIALLVVAMFAGFFIARSHHVLRSLAAVFIPDPRAVFGQNDLRILVVGLDYDYTGNDIESSAHSRSDIIMAVHLDLVHHRVYELSVPRDMVATMPDGTRAKINQAQSDGGIPEAETVVAHWLGIPPFDRYVLLRIDTMKDLINAIGGVNVKVENSNALLHAGPNGPIDYDDTWGHLHVHLKPGYQHLNGVQAVGYSRFRHDWCSDPCRIMRQQQVIRAIIAALKQNGISNILEMNALLGVIDRDVQTNLTREEQISLAASFAGISNRDIHTAQVPYVADIDLPGYGDSILPDEAAKATLVRTMLLNTASVAKTTQ